MENWTPIDDLFREKLSAGKEQLNLGAWANMERMLDGKNPYSNDEAKKKRRILPFLGIFLLLSSLFTAGYYILDKKQDTFVHNPESRHTAETSSEKKNSGKPTKAPATENNTSAGSMNMNNETAFTEPSSTNSSKGAPLHSPTKKIEEKKLSSSSSNGNSEMKPETSAIDDNAGMNPTKSKKKNKDLNFSTSKHTNANASLTKTSTETNQQELIVAEKQEKTFFDTIPQVEVKQQITRSRNGNIQAINYDTVGISQTTKEMSTNTLEPSALVDEKRIILPEESNPRYVKLDAANEKLAQHKAEIPQRASSAPATVEESNNSTASAPSLSLQQAAKNQDAKTQSGKKTSYFQDMMIAARDNYNKLREHRLTLYPGLSVGINTSMFSVHNFGGFHFGVNNLIPVNNYFTVLTELKLFYRNNSGFTINDTKSVIKDQSVDNLTLSASNQTIYATQSEQTIKKYNFKHFSMLELPILLQGHYRSLMAYGGLNLSYNFKLKINEIVQTNSISQIDTLENSAFYNSPQEKSFEFTKDDFKSRFGLGYVVGAGYNFNPNIYIDLRLSQNVWDNAKSAAQREVSNGFFKVPYVQLSIGYRFKKFAANQ